MYTLGISCYYHDSAAAPLKNGHVIAAVEEERFSRKKFDDGFPKMAIDWCLKESNISPDQIKSISFYDKPVLKFERLLDNYISVAPKGMYSFLDTIPKWLHKRLWVKNEINNHLKGFKGEIIFPEHHLSHAAHAFYTSPFEEAAILTCDYRGELECLTLSIGKNSEIKLLHKQKMPHSLGMFYATYTELMGYRPDNDEWKVMALSAYEGDCTEYADRIRSTVKFTNDGLLELDQSYYKGATFDQPKLYTQKLVKLLGNREGAPGEAIGSWHYLVAKAMQKVSEELVFKFLYKLYEETKKPNLVVGGGFFMNCVLNGKIVTNTPFENIYVQEYLLLISTNNIIWLIHNIAFPTCCHATLHQKSSRPTQMMIAPSTPPFAPTGRGGIGPTGTPPV